MAWPVAIFLIVLGIIFGHTVVEALLYVWHHIHFTWS